MILYKDQILLQFRLSCWSASSSTLFQISDSSNANWYLLKLKKHVFIDIHSTINSMTFLAFTTTLLPVRCSSFTNSQFSTTSITSSQFSIHFLRPTCNRPVYKMSAAPTPPPQTPETEGDAETAAEKRAEDELTTRVRRDLAADGINLDDLLNAGSVIQLTREQDGLIEALETLAEGSEDYEMKQKRLEEVRRKLTKVRREVMQPILKKVFLVQSIIFALAGGVLSADPDVPLVGQAFGFWMVWLFTIPALRARKGTARWEKSALNISFVLTPFVNVLLPVFTKTCILIWGADVTVLLACYFYYFRRAVNDVNLETDVEQAKIKGVLKYLDWGSWR